MIHSFFLFWVIDLIATFPNNRENVENYHDHVFLVDEDFETILDGVVGI